MRYRKARAKRPVEGWPKHKSTRYRTLVECPVCRQYGNTSGSWSQIHLTWHLECPICGQFIHKRGYWQHEKKHKLPKEFIVALKQL